MARKDVLLAMLVVVAWGLNFVVIKVGLHAMPPLMLAGLRFLLVAFPALLFVARPKVPMRLLLGYGLTISFGQFAFLFCAIKFGMPAGLASLVLQAQAFFTIILGAGIFGERLQVKQLVGIALAVVGVLVLIQASFTGQHIPLLGFMLTLAGAFSWACGNIFNKKNYAAQLAPGGDVAGGVERADPDCAVYGLLADFRRPGADAGKRGGHRYHDAAVAGLSGVYRHHSRLRNLGNAAGAV